MCQLPPRGSPAAPNMCILEDLGRDDGMQESHPSAPEQEQHRVITRASGSSSQVAVIVLLAEPEDHPHSYSCKFQWKL